MSVENSIGEWAAYQWAVMGRHQRHIARELNSSTSQICTAIAEFIGPQARYGWDRKSMVRRMFQEGAPPTKPWSARLGVWRGPKNAPFDIASIRWSISSELRQHLIYLDRQDQTPLRTVGAHWGICASRVRDIAEKEERQIKKRALEQEKQAEQERLARFARAHLAQPIELDRPSDRDIWHKFVIINGDTRMWLSYAEDD